MSVVEVLYAAKRIAVRETAGRILRGKVERADNTEKIAELMLLRGNPEPLQPEDFQRAANELGLKDPAILHAIADAESVTGGFERFPLAEGQTEKDRDPRHGRAIINVECHIFSEATNHAWDVKRPDVSYAKFTPYEKGKPPKGMARHPYAMNWDERWGLFQRQAELSIEGACCAVSVGQFQQTIGVTPTDRRAGRQEHWRELGFDSAEALFRHLCTSPFAQLEVLIRFLQVHGLVRAFAARDWQAIARGYNGSAQVVKYATAMETAWKKRLRTYNA